MSMKRFVWIGLACAAAFSAQDRNPTQEDLKIMTGKWRQMAAPGQMLKLKPKTALVFNRSDLEKINDAGNIGDYQGMIAELVKKDQAILTDTETEARLLDKFWGSCFAFLALHKYCDDSVPARLRSQFADLTAPPNARRNYGANQLGKIREQFLNHDLSSWVADHYLLVRVVGGKHDAIKGWVRMTEAQYPEQHPR